MIDHIGFGVKDAAASKEFYGPALAPLGIGVIMEWQGHVGMGRAGRPQFWFSASTTPSSPLHIAFEAENREQVRAFYAAALRAGASDNGPPGLRPHYHSHYYGAFVIDPNGHNIEAVCHKPEG